MIILIRLTSATELVESWCSWSPVSSVGDALIISFLLSISSEVHFCHHFMWNHIMPFIPRVSPQFLLKNVPFQANLHLHWTTQQNSPGGFSESYSPTAKPWKISEIFKKSAQTLKKSGKISGEIKFVLRWPKPSDHKKVQLASIFYIFYFKLIRPTLEVAHFQRGDSHNVVEKTSLSFSIFLKLAKKCNHCDHQNCYNLPSNMR